MYECTYECMSECLYLKEVQGWWGGVTKLPRSDDMIHEPSGGERQTVQTRPSVNGKVKHIDGITHLIDVTVGQWIQTSS